MATGFDFSGMDRFWTVFETLQGDQEPSAADWEALFSTPGYGVLTESEFSRDFLIRSFRLAFKPSLREQLEAALESDRFGLLRHYLQVAADPAKVRRQQEELATSGYLQDFAIKRALEYLPLSGVEEYPLVSFVIFANDARGYSPIVLDVLATINLSDFLPLFLAHECHHYYRNQLLSVDYRRASGEWRDLLRVLDQIQGEGVADLIDKEELMAGGHPFVSGYAEAVARAPEFLKTMDGILADLGKGAVNSEKAGELLNEALPMSGHPVGFYMARTIRNRLGTAEMVRRVGNPFAFLTLYDQATTAGGANGDQFRFSPAALLVLAELDERFVSR